MANATLAGFALRVNGSCASSEVTCGSTVEPFTACCPGGTVCSDHYNEVCCPPGRNCTTSLLKAPACAKSSWDMYDNEGFLFCCESGSTGYAATTNSDGCADPGYQFSSGERLLSKLTQTRASSTSTSPPAAASATASKTSPARVVTLAPAPEKSSSVGAIAGGVVGGIVFLALIGVLLWFWRHRRAATRKTDEPPPEFPASDEHIYSTDSKRVGELPAKSIPPEMPTALSYSELPAMHGKTELPAAKSEPTRMEPVELM